VVIADNSHNLTLIVRIVLQKPTKGKLLQYRLEVKPGRLLAKRRDLQRRTADGLWVRF
jgi:hypothetical protein